MKASSAAVPRFHDAYTGGDGTASSARASAGSDGGATQRNQRDQRLPAVLDGVKLLLLEDHEDTRQTLATGLRRHGADVYEAGSAQAALLLVEHNRPDLMVVDIELPEIDGVDFLKAVRRLPGESGARTPAVALTVHNQPDDRRRSILAGFRLHLAKPMTAGELASKLATLLRLSPHRARSS